MDDPVQRWEPKVGDPICYTSSSSWGPNKFVPLVIQAGRVTQVTKAGYIYIQVRGGSTSGDKFMRIGPRHFKQWSRKSDGSTGSYRVIKLVTEEEHAALPQNNADARAYAKNLARGVTVEERRMAALMAEAPGDPDTFEFEKLSAVAQAMVRQRLKEINDG